MVNTLYYSNLFDGISELKQNNDARREKTHQIQPLEGWIVHPIGKLVTEKVAYPLFVKIYECIGRLSIYALSLSGKEEKASWLQSTWYDPISTNQILLLAHRIKKASLFLAIRNPTWIPLIKYPDTCMIVALRHLYIFASDLHSVFSLPNQMRVHADNIFEATENQTQQDEIDTYLNRAKNLVKTATTYVANTGKEALRNKTYAVIKEKEDALRVLIIRKIAKSTIKKSTEIFIKCTLRSLIGYSFYKLTESVIDAAMIKSNKQTLEISHEIAKTTSFFLTLFGIIFWAQCLIPSIKRLYKSAEIKFDPEASTFNELSKQLEEKSKIEILTKIYTALKSDELKQAFSS